MQPYFYQTQYYTKPDKLEPILENIKLQQNKTFLMYKAV